MKSGSIHLKYLRQFKQPLAFLTCSLTVIIATGVLYLLKQFLAEADIIMAYLAVVLVLAYYFSRSSTVFSIILSVALFDFFFVSPQFTFAIDHEKYLISFAVMAIVGFMFSSFSEKLKVQLRDTREREIQQRNLYQFACSLAAVSWNKKTCETIQHKITTLFDANIVFCQLTENKIHVLFSGDTPLEMDRVLISNIEACLKNNQKINQKIGNTVKIIYLPIGHQSSPIIALVFLQKAMLNEEVELLQTYVSVVNLAVTRSQVFEQAADIKLRAESEQLRNAILSAVSHDLRTPLGTIIGLASTLLDTKVKVHAKTSTELLEIIYKVAEQLSQKVTNLLQMSRNMRGQLTPKLELQNPDEMIGSVLTKMSHRLKYHNVDVKLDETLLIPCDVLLMEVVLSNLLDNAVKFSQEHSLILISGMRIGQFYQLSIRDQGCGILDKNKHQLFEHYFSADWQEVNGIGLGLAIVKVIIEAHGGQVSVLDAPTKGADFLIMLPLNINTTEALVYEQ